MSHPCLICAFRFQDDDLKDAGMEDILLRARNAEASYFARDFLAGFGGSSASASRSAASLASRSSLRRTVFLATKALRAAISAMAVRPSAAARSRFSWANSLRERSSFEL